MSVDPEQYMHESISLVFGELTASISPDGAWLERFDNGDQPVLFPKTVIADKTRGGCHVCLPNFGPAKPEDNLKQHGFGRESVWTVQERTDNETTLSLSACPRPYDDMSAQLQYLLDDAGLHMTLLVQNNGEEPLRVAPGFHPYFATGEAASVTIDDTSYATAELNPAKLLDHDVQQLTIADKNVTLRSDGLHQWVLWTDGAGAYTCLEPTQAGASFENEATDSEMLLPGMTRVWALRIGVASE